MSAEQKPIDGNDLTLRDRFALKGIEAYFLTSPRRDLAEREVADWCYRFADAMLKARDAKKGGAQ